MHTVTSSVRIQQSQVWQTNTGIVAVPGGVLLVDPGVLPSELDAVMDALGDTPVVAGFATHAHWDHVLWPAGLDGVPRYASAETAAIASRNEAKIIAQIDGFGDLVKRDYGQDVTWDLSRIADFQPLPLGEGTIAGVAVDLVDVSGHADGQVALVLPEHDVAFVADTLSDVETPSLARGRGQLERYLATLDRLQAVIDRVTWIVPGHGAVADRAEAQRRLDLDRRYLLHLRDAVAAAPVGDADDALAARILADLGETRAGEGLSAEMHRANVGLLRQ